MAETAGRRRAGSVADQLSRLRAAFGRLKAVGPDTQKARREPGFPEIRRMAAAYFYGPSMPLKLSLKRETRPPRSSRWPWPPVQAGWVLGSMSSCSVSPSLP